MKRLTCLIVIISLTWLALPGCAWFQNATKTPPEVTAQAYYGKAMAMRDAGRPEMAAENLQAALNLDPDMYHAYYQLGLIYRENKQPQVARQVWSTGIQRASLGPDRPDYPRVRAAAEMRAAMAGLDSASLVVAAEKVMADQKAKEVVITETVVKPAPKEPVKKDSGKYAVLFSSNLKKVSASGDVRLLKAKGWEATVKTVKMRGKTWYRVWAACCTGRAEALQNKAKISKATGRRGLEVMVP